MPTKQIITALLPLLLLILVSAMAQSAHADYYKYTDGTGSVCITNKIESVPLKYRATMKVIREETLAAKDKVKRPEPLRDAQPVPAASAPAPAKTAAAAEEPTSTYSRLAARHAWFKPALIVGAVILLYLIVRKIAAALPSALFARLLCIVFFLGVFVFLYVSYTRYLSSSYFTFKTKMFALFEKSNRREAPEPGERPLPLPDRGQADR
jgi:hypothetical protein